MGFSDRLRLLFTRAEAPVLRVDEPGLRVVVSAFDPAEADSAALRRASSWRPDEPAVLRHHLRLPPDRLGEAADLIAQDGYELREVGPDGTGLIRVHALRAQVLDALRCAQERSRMAGLAQRLDGEADGWDGLQTGGRETDNIGSPDLA